MIIARVIGGLGNQMFQYAAGRCLARRLGVELKLDITGYLSLEQNNDTLREFQLKKLNIKTLIACEQEIEKSKFVPENFLQRHLRERRKKARSFSDFYYKEPHFHFDKKFYSRKDGTYLFGYWQSEKYFKEIKKQLQVELQPRNLLDNNNAIFAEKILAANAVSIHVRRGDYILNAKTNEYHGVCSIKYYLSAIKKMSLFVDNPTFFVFSDEIGWAKKTLKAHSDIYFIENNGQDDACEDLRLMSMCKHNIIANSSFSWWGAWLNGNPDKIVIAPRKWFANAPNNTKDLIPSSWNRL